MSRKDFISLADVYPDIKIQADYSSEENFTGQIVPGYKARKALLASVPARALSEVQKDAKSRGLCLKVFDAYRPAKAVKFFLEWSNLPESNTELKEIYYPKYSRLELFQNGFLSERSSHSRGCTVDLTLIDDVLGTELDMGSRFDYFDTISHTDSPLISAHQMQNRLMLKSLMEAHGFKNYSKEWWHYTYRPEPYPDQAFDFDIE